MKKQEIYDEFDEFDGNKDAVDIKPYVQACLKHWKKIVVWALCSMVVGILLALSVPKTYTSHAVVAPELVTRSSSSNSLTTLASLAGVNINTLALSDAMHPDLYPSVIKSTNFYIGLFDLPVTVKHKKETIQTDLYDYLVNYNRSPWWGYVMGVPRMAINVVKRIFAEEDEFETAEGHAQMDSLRLTRQQSNVVKYLSKNISAVVEKKTFALSVKVTMQDAVIAAQVANAVIEHLEQFVMQYRTEKARETVAYYERVYEETHDEYLAAQRAAARYADSNLGTMTQSAKMYLQQLQNEAQLRYQMYNTTSQNLLAAQARVLQEAPVLVVIQPGIAPNDGKPSKVKAGLLWMILGAAVGIFLVVRKVKK